MKGILVTGHPNSGTIPLVPTLRLGVANLRSNQGIEGNSAAILKKEPVAVAYRTVERPVNESRETERKADRTDRRVQSGRRRMP